MGSGGQQPQEHFASARTDEQVKEETAAAYNKVGQTAYKEGDDQKAKAVMNYLGYTDEEFSLATPDAYNYQGVGCPFRFADIAPGHKVLDVGSGLGVDSSIAMHKVSESGSVVGLDLSEQEVLHSNKKMAERNVDPERVKFVTGDMEAMPKTADFADNTYDVVISNGAFCMAPSKEKAFKEIFRVLKPGGKMAICTSVVKMDLNSGIKWPLCMEMFIHQDRIAPICEKLGFVGIKIDDSNSLMHFDVEGTFSEKLSKTDKNKVHNDSAEFKHLKQMN